MDRMTLRHCIVPSAVDDCFLEADYRQLEIRMLAVISGDPTLAMDLEEGKDPHKYFAGKIFGVPMDAVTPKQRKLAKAFSFQLQYGASAAGIAKKWGVAEILVKVFINEYFSRYPKVKAWQEKVQEGIETDSVVNDHTIGGYPLKTSKIYSGFDAYSIKQEEWQPTGKISWPAPKLKNYPVQGMAASLMLLVLGKLLKHAHLFSFKMTTHDSITVQSTKGHLKGNAAVLRHTMESVPELLKEHWGITTGVAFPVDMFSGKSLGEMVELPKL